MLFGNYGYLSSFEQTYRCYPASFIDKPQLESGDKVIMPPSALDRLASLHVDYPMLFELQNPSTQRMSHCGVLEFIAEEGMIYMPYWMMQNMLLEEGDTVKIKNATLPKGTYVKLQPHTKDFLDISNPKAVLETTLRNFSCLTTGDSIMVAYNNKKYYIDIVETKPASAISIIETDCEVDFAPPLDYKEPDKLPAVPAAASTTSQEESKEAEEAKFSPFTGVGRRLDGKPLKYSVAPITTGSSDVTKNNPPGSGSSSVAPSRRPSGKLVFGSSPGSSNQVDAPKASVKELKREAPKEELTKEEPKFQAFTGKKYSLKD